MDPISQERFNTLRKTDPANWTEADFAFMQARRPYLSADEVKVFGLEPSEETVDPYAGLSLKKLKKIAAERKIDIASVEETAEAITAALVAADEAAEQPAA